MQMRNPTPAITTMGNETTSSVQWPRQPFDGINRKEWRSNVPNLEILHQQSIISKESMRQ